MNNKLKLYQWAVGGMDACTGVLLVLFPAWTLKLMGMTQPPTPVDTISFVGVFVMSVGLSYFLVSENDKIGWKMQWKLTGMFRAFVACFLTWKIFFCGWEIRWATVLFTDISIAVIQFVGLKKGWLDKKTLQMNHLK